MPTTSYHSLERPLPARPTGCPMDATFSTFSDAYVADPYAELNPRREETPVFYSEQLDMMVVTRMEDLLTVFRDPATFSSENVQDPVFPLAAETVEILSAPDFDPVAVMSNRQEPDHARIRRHTTPGFSNRRMKVLERWKVFEDDPRYRSAFDRETLELSNRIFGDVTNGAFASW